MNEPSNLVELKAAPASAEIVELLQCLLERAHRGQIRAIAVAVHERPMDTGSTFSLGTDGDVAHLVTAIERVKLRLLHEGENGR